MASPENEVDATPGESGANGTVKRGSHSREYILQRLEREGHAELASQVRCGAISAFRAAIAAGFSKPPDPLEELKRKVDQLSKEDFRAFFVWLLTYAKTRRH